MKFMRLIFCFLQMVSMPALCASNSNGLSDSWVSSTANEIVAADAQRTTVDGNNFMVPAGWSIRTAGSAVVLTAPEGGSHIALVDVGSVKDAEAAVAAAWVAYDPAAKWPVKRTTDQAVRNGWEQIRSFRYETPATDQRGVSAQARRHGERWTVVLYDMADSVAGKRDAQLELIYGRLLPKGYVPETFAGKTARKLDPTRIAALKQFIESARQQLKVPGVAVGIVQDGKAVFAEGFGVRAVGKPDKVDADTLFMIASNNKALTTLMLAKLVDAGKFTWDTPATEVLPTFKLGDADTTRQVLMKHLVCACTGMPRQDMETIFEGEHLTPESVVGMLATMHPTSQFGELYQYSNLMADAAGYAGGHALHPQLELGAAYDAAMQALVFDPLGMTSTTFDFTKAQRGNHAFPHGQDIDGDTVPSSMDLNHSAIPTRPDGGAWSNVNDMLRYVQMELDEGLLPDGNRYIGEAPLLARRVQQVATGNDTGYGMGLKLDRSMGTPLVQHGGVASGYISNMMWLPEHNVGAVILTNADAGGSAIRYLFRRYWLELLFDGSPEAVANTSVEANRMQEDVLAKRNRLTVPADPAVVGDLAARYRSPELGDMLVSTNGAATWFDFGGWRSEVASRRRDDGTAALVLISPGAPGFEFAVTSNGSKRSIALRDEQNEYVFVEVE